jgi:hypothetical protein
MNSFFEHHKDSIRWHYRPHSAQWADSTFPAAGAGRRLLQYVSTNLSGDTVHLARHRKPVPALGDRTAAKHNIPIVEGRRAVVTNSLIRTSDEPSPAP